MVFSLTISKYSSLEISSSSELYNAASEENSELSPQASKISLMDFLVSATIGVSTTKASFALVLIALLIG